METNFELLYPANNGVRINDKFNFINENGELVFNQWFYIISKN